MQHKWQAFTLVELLIVLAVIGVLATIMFPIIFGGRTSAINRSAQAHANHVYKAAIAYIISTSDDLVTSNDCTTGYFAGAFSAPNPGGGITNCTVNASATGSPIVTVTSSAGITYSLP